MKEDAATLVRFTGDEATVKQLIALFEETLSGDDVALASFETLPQWTFEAYFGASPEQAALRDLVTTAFGKATGEALVFETIATRDWVKASLEGLKPVTAGRFMIHGAHSRDDIPINRIGIEIEAALAFGTGHHGTTRGCLLALDQILKATTPKHVLDVGTGTGVLAIAAARALHRPVRASDTDPSAVRVARENMQANRVGPLIETIVARGVGVQRLRRDRYDLVFANILAAPLRAMSFALSDLVAPGGHIILSGLMAEHAHGVLAAYRAQNMILRRRILLEGWVTYVMQRPR